MEAEVMAEVGWAAADSEGAETVVVTAAEARAAVVTAAAATAAAAMEAAGSVAATAAMAAERVGRRTRWCWR